MVATDGHRLAYCQAELEGATLARHEVIIPRKTVLELQRLLSDGDEPVSIDVAANQVRLRFAKSRWSPSWSRASSPTTNG